MGKMMFGSPSATKPLRRDIQKAQEVDMEAVFLKVMLDHADTFKKLAQVEKPQQPVASMVMPQQVVHTIEKTTTKDKLARRHAKLMRLSITQELAEIAESMSGQDELFHMLKRDMKGLSERLEALETRKPEEKQIVTEKQTETVVKTTTSKLVIAGVILSIALNVLALLTH